MRFWSMNMKCLEIELESESSCEQNVSRRNIKGISNWKINSYEQFNISSSIRF